MPDGNSTDDTEQITVECPHCGHRFETHDVGDLAGCEECRQTFPRFTNIVQSDTGGNRDV